MSESSSVDQGDSCCLRVVPMLNLQIRQLLAWHYFGRSENSS